MHNVLMTNLFIVPLCGFLRGLLRVPIWKNGQRKSKRKDRKTCFRSFKRRLGGMTTEFDTMSRAPSDSKANLKW